MTEIEHNAKDKKEGVFDDGEFTVIVLVDAGFWHMSVSHPIRYPKWSELKAFRYKYLPNEIMVAQLFPPKEEYVNVHPNCFHLWEIEKGSYL